MFPQTLIRHFLFRIRSRKDNPDERQPSTSKERLRNDKTNEVSSSSKRGRKSQWNDEDMLALFKLIKQEYYAILKTREPMASKPWSTVIKRIADKKLFKVSSTFLNFTLTCENKLLFIHT